jgi:methionine synthase II (cobalamin-independent)
MFATLAGGLPAPPVAPAGDPTVGDAAVLATSVLAARLKLQVAAGLEPLTDGGEASVPDAAQPGALAARWRATAAATDRLVKAVLVGPCTIGRAAGSSRRDRERATLAAAESGADELRALAAAGCAMVQVDEPAMVKFADRPSEWRLLADAHRRLTDRVEGLHLSLAITGGDLDETRAKAIFDLGYASYLFDLIAGPDNWRLIARAPTERGIVCGVVPTTPEPAVVKEVLVWAAQYAASTNGRGIDRVGLATAGSLAGLPWELAASRVELLGLGARLAVDGSMERLAMELDPRAVGMKSAAAGRNLPVPERKPRRRPPR